MCSHMHVCMKAMWEPALELANKLATGGKPLGKVIMDSSV